MNQSTTLARLTYRLGCPLNPYLKFRDVLTNLGPQTVPYMTPNGLKTTALRQSHISATHCPSGYILATGHSLKTPRGNILVNSRLVGPAVISQSPLTRLAVIIVSYKRSFNPTLD